MPAVVLNEGRDKPTASYRHPWIFSGSVGKVEEGTPDGAVVDVRAASGEWLARGYWNSRSQIALRVLTWDQGEAVDAAFWRRRLERAVRAREELLDEDTDSCRLVHAEADGLPGLIVDRHAGWLVAQVLTAGMDAVKGDIFAQLKDICRPEGLVERSDTEARQKEGIKHAVGVVYGRPPRPAAGDEDGLVVEIRQNGLRFHADLLRGQKTGFYLDQAVNRARVAAHLRGRRVLDAFCHSGAFGVHALAAGAAHVTQLDSSREALEMAERNLRLNGFDPDGQVESWHGDAFEVMRDMRRRAFAFDAVILDPPKLAPTRKTLADAMRAYRDANIQGMRLLRPGGILATFSCSGLLSAEEFQRLVWSASRDAGREAVVLERLGQGPDHPVRLSFPEGEYLKGFILRLD